MEKEILEMMELQGDIRIYLMSKGIVDGALSNKMAAELLDMVMESGIAKEEHIETYNNNIYFYGNGEELQEFEYPMWFKHTGSELVVKFTSLYEGEVVINGVGKKVGDFSSSWFPHTNIYIWKQVEGPVKEVSLEELQQH